MITLLYRKSINSIDMGRKKLIEKYELNVEKIEGSDYLTYLTIFQKYSEQFIKQIKNWVERRYGNHNLQFLLLEEQRWWGTKYRLEIKIPRRLKNWGRIEKTIIRYSRGIVPDPRILNMYRIPAENTDTDYDVIVVEIKDMLPPLF